MAAPCRFSAGNNCRCAVFKMSERPGAPQPNALAYFGSTIAPRCRAIFLGAAHVGVGEAQRPAPVLPLYRAPSGDRKVSKTGERGGNRTHDPLIKSQMLYRLSYALEGSRDDVEARGRRRKRRGGRGAALDGGGRCLYEAPSPARPARRGSAPVAARHQSTPACRPRKGCQEGAILHPCRWTTRDRATCDGHESVGRLFRASSPAH